MRRQRSSVSRPKTGVAVQLLIDRGEPYVIFKAPASMGHIQMHREYVWFWSAGIIFERHKNQAYTVALRDDRWQIRKDRGMWYSSAIDKRDLATTAPNALETFFQENYIKLLNDKIVGEGEDDESEAEHVGSQQLHEPSDSASQSGSQGEDDQA